MEHDFEARIARAKEAARLASIAAAARENAPIQPPPQSAMSISPSSAFHPPPPRPPVPSSAPLFIPPLARSPPPATLSSIPVDLRHRIDRLVEFVQRNGIAFEEAAKERERDNPDFEFLKPGAPYHDYYAWRKAQAGILITPSPLPPVPPAWRNPPAPPVPPSSGSAEMLSNMTVGAMANVAKYSRQQGIPPYAPIPSEIILNVGMLPPVEPARLEIRLAEFYRQET